MTPRNADVTVAGQTVEARDFDLHDPERCRAASDVLTRVGDKWSVLVVMVLGKEDSLRFNELKRRIGSISQRMLTRTLRGLERDGLVSRLAHATVPPRVDYALTPLGRSLQGPALTLSSWSVDNYGAILAARDSYDAPG